MARATARADRLVEQLRPHIRDERVLAAIAAVPRDLFVPRRLWPRHGTNTALPIGAGQTISQPVVVARMCELLELRGDERVLDVGTGSGYHAAVLAQLAAEVWSIEREPQLSRRAAQALEAAGVRNVHLVVGDGSRGHPPAAPYDAINVAAAAQRASRRAALEEQLAEGGRLVAPVDGPDQRLMLVRRTPDELRAHMARAGPVRAPRRGLTTRTRRGGCERDLPGRARILFGQARVSVSGARSSGVRSSACCRSTSCRRPGRPPAHAGATPAHARPRSARAGRAPRPPPPHGVHAAACSSAAALSRSARVWCSLASRAVLVRLRASLLAPAHAARAATP